MVHLEVIMDPEVNILHIEMIEVLKMIVLLLEPRMVLLVMVVDLGMI